MSDGPDEQKSFEQLKYHTGNSKVKVKVKVYVYSSDKPVGSADITSLFHSLISLGRMQHNFLEL